MRPCLAVFGLALSASSWAAPAAAAPLGEQARQESAYRAALAAWAGGDDTGALAQLLRLDGAPVAGSRAAVRLERAKLAVARAIGRDDPAGILAAAALELRAYRDYARRRPSLAGEARRAVAMLVEQHLASDRRPATAALDAAFLASLAGDLAAGSQRTAAAELYAKALAYDPGQNAARLGLAALYEQSGEYATALDLLAPLVAAEPAAREARLRLAVNEARLGRERAAEADLRRLLGDGVDWVRSLAAQELARMLAMRGDVAGAAQLLSDTAALLPCDPTLPVQAALLAERAGTSLPLDLASLGACGEAAESARSRYTHAPTSELVPLRESLEGALPEWRRALARKLGTASAATVGQ